MSKINGLILFFFILFISFFTSQSQTWTEIPSGTAQNLWGVDIFSETTAYVVGDQGTILKSTNSGDSWLSLTSGTTSYFNSIKFINSSTGWAVGEAGTIAKTTNGGTNWIYQSTGSGSPIGDLVVYDTQTLWVFMSAGQIYYSGDGGDNWFLQSTPVGETFWSGFLIDANTIYSVGTTGAIIKTVNGGTNWIQQPSGTTEILWDVFFPSNQIGYVVGDNGVILKTTNGGSNWVAQTSGFVGTLYSVYFKDNYIGWAVGVTGKILKTTDGGSNWVNEPSGTAENLTRIEFNGSTGIISAQGGKIFKYNLFPPTLNNVTISNITSNGANLASSISSDGNLTITEKGFVIGTSSNPTITSNVLKLSGGSGTSTFLEQVSTLNSGTLYFVRSFATNAEGTTYSDQVSFTTLTSENLPNDGDGNGDGIVDSLQNHVKTILTYDGSSYLTIVELDNKTIYDVSALESNDNNDNIFYPFGLVQFKVNSNTSRIKIIYHGIEFLNNIQYKKINSNGKYYNFNNYEVSFETIGDNQVATIILNLTDGGPGDYDGVVNGIIYDPGGPALPVTANIPFWDWWWVLLLIPGVIYIYLKNQNCNIYNKLKSICLERLKFNKKYRYLFLRRNKNEKNIHYFNGYILFLFTRKIRN